MIMCAHFVRTFRHFLGECLVFWAGVFVRIGLGFQKIESQGIGVGR